MRKYIIAVFLCFSAVLLSQGKTVQGEISFISSQNVYVKFDNTGGITEGDTLFYNSGNNLVPALLVKFISSTSVAATKISDIDFQVGMNITANVSETASTDGEQVVATEEENAGEVYVRQSYKRKEKSKYYGKFSLGSYTFSSNLPGDVPTQRWKYRVSFTHDEFFDKNLSFDSYLNFSYRTKDWARVSNNPGEALKVYSLNLKYKVSDKLHISLGRKINRKLTNVGAYDGLDAEYNWNNNYIGAIVGSRPNFSDYGYNLKLFQFGVYFSREDSLAAGPMKNSLSLMNQTNNFNTDRRFLYFQHTNYFVDRLYFFASTEVDLYTRENGVEKNSIRFTSLYTSLRYNLRPVSISLSYDARNNVIYYETYKSFADSLLEYELRQGLRARVTYKFLRYMSAGVTAGYRTRGDDREPSKNYGVYYSHSRIPYIETSGSVNYNRLETSYLTGDIVSIRLSRSFQFMNSNISLGYRSIKYLYKTTDYKLNQNIFSLDIGSNIFDNIYLHMSYEGIFEKIISYNRFYANISYRLR